MTASSRSRTCSLRSRRRTLRALVSTVGVLAFAVGTPVVVGLAVSRVLSGTTITDSGGASGLGPPDWAPLVIAFAAILAWLPGGVAVVSEVCRRDRPVRPSSFVPPGIRRVVARHVEASLLGAGTLRGWTSTRVDASLADFEIPARWSEPRDEPEPDAGQPRKQHRTRRESRGVRKASLRWAARQQAGGDGAAVVRPGSSAAQIPTVVEPVPKPWTREVETIAYAVQRADTWWGLAERFLGDGRRFPELKELNAGRTQPDGTAVRPDAVLRPGWIIELPKDGSDV